MFEIEFEWIENGCGDGMCVCVFVFFPTSERSRSLCRSSDETPAKSRVTYVPVIKYVRIHQHQAANSMETVWREWQWKPYIDTH